MRTILTYIFFAVMMIAITVSVAQMFTVALLGNFMHPALLVALFMIFPLSVGVAVSRTTQHSE